MRWALEIPGPPVAKGRPRVTRTGVAYTPAKTRRYEDAVRQLAVASRPPLMEGPVRVQVIATIEPPRSWSRRKTAAHLGRPHCQRPDADNIAKAVIDALNRIIWRDDAQIWSLSVRKEWGHPARVTVIVDDEDRDAWEHAGDVARRIVAGGARDAARDGQERLEHLENMLKGGEGC